MRRNVLCKEWVVLRQQLNYAKAVAIVMRTDDLVTSSECEIPFNDQDCDVNQSIEQLCVVANHLFSLLCVLNVYSAFLTRSKCQFFRSFQMID